MAVGVGRDDWDGAVGHERRLRLVRGGGGANLGADAAGAFSGGGIDAGRTNLAVTFTIAQLPDVVQS